MCIRDRATPKNLNDLKLQNQHADKVAQENYESALALANVVAVSYTHLDVYKRQHLHRASSERLLSAPHQTSSTS